MATLPADVTLAPVDELQALADAASGLFGDLDADEILLEFALPIFIKTMKL